MNPRLIVKTLGALLGLLGVGMMIPLVFSLLIQARCSSAASYQGSIHYRYRSLVIGDAFRFFALLVERCLPFASRRMVRIGFGFYDNGRIGDRRCRGLSSVNFTVAIAVAIPWWYGNSSAVACGAAVIGSRWNGSLSCRGSWSHVRQNYGTGE